MTKYEAIYQLMCMLSRGVGKSYEVAEVCRRKEWPILTETEQQAKRLSADHGIKAYPWRDWHRLVGKTGPYLMDHYAVAGIAKDAMNDIHKLQTQLSEAGDLLVQRVCAMSALEHMDADTAAFEWTKKNGFKP